MLGGLLGHKHSNSGHANNDNGTYFIDGPDFLALASAECDPITFVVYQKNDMNNTTIYLRGDKKSGTWNGSSSPVLNETILNLSPPDLPAVNTNTTAVCWRDNNSNSMVSIETLSISPSLLMKILEPSSILHLCSSTRVNAKSSHGSIRLLWRPNQRLLSTSDVKYCDYSSGNCVGRSLHSGSITSSQQHSPLLPRHLRVWKRLGNSP